MISHDSFLLTLSLMLTLVRQRPLQSGVLSLQYDTIR